MKSAGRAFVVFAFMALLTVHFGTGLLASFTEKVPRAVEGLDTVLQVGLVSWFGRPNTLALLALLTLLLPVLIYYRGSRDDRQSRPLRAQPVIERSPKRDIRPEDQKLLADILQAAVAQVAHGREMAEANERPKPFVRLVPQVPIVSRAPVRSWFGGNPSLPAGADWPTRDGKPAAFLAQIDCSDLPPDLWDGAGPRTGWLSFFLGYENGYLAAKVLHTRLAGAPTPPPAAIDFEWRETREISGMDWTSLLRKDIPKWPVDVVWVSAKEEDPLAQPRGSSDDNPRFVRYRTGFDLNDPGWKPFDWTTALLMLDTAAAHARENARKMERDVDRLTKTLEHLSANPESHRDPATERERREAQAARANHLASVWRRCESQVEALRARAAAQAASRPFSQALADDLIAELAAIKREDRGGEAAAQAFPPVFPPNGSSHWLTKWATLAHNHATHLYAADPRTLPPAWRAKFEEQAAFDAKRAMGTMREVPEGYVHEFAFGSEVTLLQLPTSHLMNWMWGDDTYDLVLTIRMADLARGEFGRVKVQITN